jgi:DNA polymerase-3 subunit beta
MSSFTVNSREFLEAISALAPLVPQKPSRDILKCFKIVANQGLNDSVVIQATDIETYASSTLETNVMVQTPGEFTVPAQTLLDYIKVFDGDSTLTLLVTPEEVLRISDENDTEFQVGVEDMDEYPDFPEAPDNPNWVTILLPALTRALSQVIFAVADKGSPRWGTLNAVCLETGDRKITLIGTDQHRASVVDFDVEETLEEASYLVPSKTLSLVPKIFKGDELQISFEDPHSLTFNDGITQILIRLMHGNYPPVKNFMPTSTTHPNSLELDASSFLKEVKKSSLATDKHSTLKVELSSDKVTLKTRTREQRKSAKVEHRLDYTGDDFEFAINCKYLLDMLKASSGDIVVMRFNQNTQPILFTQNNFRHFLVPQEVR